MPTSTVIRAEPEILGSLTELSSSLHSSPPSLRTRALVKRVLRLFLLLVIAGMLGQMIVRSVIPAFTAQKTDFSTIYFASRFWVNGEDPYNADRVTELSRAQTGSDRRVVPMSSPTTLMLLAPLTLLPWRWASGLWACLGVLAVLLTGWSVTKMADVSVTSTRGLALMAFVAAFSPLQVGAELQNISLQVTALCLLAMALQHGSHLRAASVVTALAICLKPQLSLWLLGYLWLEGGVGIALWAAGLSGLLAALAWLRIGISPLHQLAELRMNLSYFARPGGLNDLTATNPGRFHMIYMQVLTTQLWGATPLARWVPVGIAGLGVLIWLYAVRRTPALPPTLLLTPLAGLCLLAVYHRIYDLGVLLPAIAWVWNQEKVQGRTHKILVTALLSLLIPLRSLIYRLEPHLSQDIRESWGWQCVMLPHATWIICALVVILLAAVVTSKWTPVRRTHHGVRT